MDYGPSLEKAKFEKVFAAPKGSEPPRTEFFTLRKGDIAIIQTPNPHGKIIRNGKAINREGHIAIYDGKQWVSDHIQNGKDGGFWPGPLYRIVMPSYNIYRLPHNMVK